MGLEPGGGHSVWGFFASYYRVCHLALFYVSATVITLSPSVAITGTFEVTLATGASVTIRYANLTSGSVIAGDVATFISQVQAKVGSTLQVSIVKVA